MYHFRDMAAPVAGERPLPQATPVFNAEEALVLQLAAHETVSSVRTPGRFARILAWAFAVRPVAPLANARLEALRRAAILARVEGVMPAPERDMLIGHGFSPAQVALIG
jgi:hypothetical protein